MPKQISPKAVALTFGVLVLCSAIAFYAGAWTEPSGDAPTNNVSAPLNTSITGQSKAGGLILNVNGADYGLIVQNGNVGIGNSSPLYKLDVSGDIRWTGTLRGGAVPWARLNLFPSACPSGQYVTAFGSSLICSTPSGSGGDITGVTAGTGLGGGGTSGNVTLSADTNYLQRIVSGTCTTGFSIRVINSDGTVSCETDDVGITLESDPKIGTLTNGKWCIASGSQVNCTNDAPGGSMGGSGTANYLSKFITGTTLGNSQIYENGTNVGIGTTNPGYKLDVQNGQINAAGGLCIGGTCQTSWPTSIPSGMIAMFDTSCPSGWSRFTALDGRIPYGSSSYGSTGGSSSHTHTLTVGGSCSALSVGTCGQGGGYIPAGGGTALYVAPQTADTQSNLPPYLTVVWCRKN